MLKKLFQNLKESKPLIYSVTNNVTVNDCANALLALGASAIMSSEILEVKDLVESSKAVNINIGTINKKSFKFIFHYSSLNSLEALLLKSIFLIFGFVKNL